MPFEMNFSDKFKEIMGMATEVVEGAPAVGKAVATAIDLKDTDQWRFHAYVDQTKTKPHMNEWAGGYNRKSRNAGSFYGGYDAAMRWPDRIEELKTLAKGYQMVDAFKSAVLLKGEQGSFKNEMEDALANISGIEAAQRDMKAGKKYTLEAELEEDILKAAKQYAETYTNKE